MDSDFASYFAVWDQLTPSQQEHLLQTTAFQQVKKGTILHGGQEDCLGLILVCRGQLRTYLLSEEGREVTICRFFDRDVCLFTAACVLPNMMFDIFIEAEKDTELWVVPACLFQNLSQESLPIANYSRDLITHHFSQLMWLMEQIMWKSFDKRLAKFLVEESAVENTHALKITHEKIANHMGTAREVVTRMLRYFQEEGMLRLTRGTVELLDLPRLKRLANG